MHKLSARQRTLADALEFSGIGVHSGLPVSLIIEPASPDTGYTITRRLDDGRKVGPVPVHFSRVTRTTLCTTIDLGDSTSVATVEHVISALSGMGVDNAHLILTGAECPIIDGSAWPLVQGMQDVGLMVQPAPRRYIKIMRQVLVRNLVLVDSRHGLKDVDREMMKMLDEAAVGYRVVMTKADKIKASELAATLAQVEAEARKHPAAYPVIHVTSSEKKMGIDELRAAVLTDVRT